MVTVTTSSGTAERFFGSGRVELLQTIERAEDTSVEEVGQDHRDRRSPAVVQGQEARWLELPRRRGTLLLARHPRVHRGQRRHGGDQHEERVHQADELLLATRLPGASSRRPRRRSLAKIQPLMKCTPKPITLARSRFGVTMVPSMKGIFILLRPSAWLPAIRVVRTTRADEPPERDAALVHLRSSTRFSVGVDATLTRPRSVPVFGERERRVDQPDVRECLREVPERGAGLRVDLLGE